MAYEEEEEKDRLKLLELHEVDRLHTQWPRAQIVVCACVRTAVAGRGTFRPWGRHSIAECFHIQCQGIGIVYEMRCAFGTV